MHISLEANCLTIHWNNDESSALPYLWLRDTDPSGFHPQTGERTFDLTQVPLDVKADSAHIDDDTLIVSWPDKAEPSRFPLEWVRQHAPGKRRPDPAEVSPRLWRSELGASSVARFSAESIMDSDAVLVDWLRATKRDGLSIVEALPDDIEAGMTIARRVGRLRATNFGTTFEVISKADPNNLAYTAEALPLHTDLTNQELPPGYQFLHCLANGAIGGGSLFCDGFAVATDLRRDFPDLAKRLERTTIPFRFFDADTDIRARKSVIASSPTGEITEICFNAHLADIIDLEPESLPAYYAAYQQLMMMTRSPEYCVSFRLVAGEMVVFDNRRVLHGREAFQPTTGKRHLHGCYVDRGDWDSRLRVVSAASLADQ